MNRISLTRRRGCIVLPVLAALISIAACGAIASLALNPGQPDALEELKALPPYPGVAFTNYGGNVRYHEPHVVLPGGGIAFVASSPQGIEVITASIAFDATDEPNRVREYYSVQLPQLGYDAVWDRNRTRYAYIKGRSTQPGPLMRVWGSIFPTDYPSRTYYIIDLLAVKEFPTGGPKSGVTHVQINYTIYSGAGFIE